MLSPDITEIIVEFQLSTKKYFFDLKQICESTCDVIFDSSKSPKLRFRNRQTNSSIHFFSKGFGRIFASKSLKNVDISLSDLRKNLKDCGYQTKVIGKRIITISATFNLKQTIRNLNKIVEDLNGSTSEKYSGINIEINNLTVIIFEKGIVKFLKGKTIESIIETNNYLIEYFLKNNHINS